MWHDLRFSLGWIPISLPMPFASRALVSHQRHMSRDGGDLGCQICGIYCTLWWWYLDGCKCSRIHKYPMGSLKWLLYPVHWGSVSHSETPWMKCRSVEPLLFFLGSPIDIWLDTTKIMMYCKYRMLVIFFPSMECHCLNSALNNLQQPLGPLWGEIHERVSEQACAHLWKVLTGGWLGSISFLWWFSPKFSCKTRVEGSTLGHLGFIFSIQLFTK